MDVFVKEAPEPLSPNAKSQDSLLAESAVYNKLNDELRKYTIGDIGGSSVLISGHRGSGKTTLVHKSIQDLARELTRGRVNRRPLLVPLHGPNLLSKKPDPHNPIAKRESTATKEGEDVKEIEKENLNRNALGEIVLSLYRALSNEFGESYAARLNKETTELAGQFRIELDEASDISIFRQFWKKIGKLRFGILFVNRGNDDQGVKELLALSSAAQAYRIMSGEVKNSETNEQEDARQETITNKVEINFKEVVDGFMSLFVGIATGAAAFQVSGENLLITGLASITGAILGKWAFSFTRTTTRKRAFKRDYTFIRDRTVSVLDREVPILINRVRSAGLAPIFVIDELDKVIPPYKDFGELIGHLKHFVSDRSFFIFLTDRNYFEHIVQLSSNETYSKEYTYFTHRFFIYYSPRDLHEYLGRKFSSKSKDLRLLNYLLLYRARLHAIDLKREIRKLKENGQISIPSEELKSRIAFRFHIMIQIAIEYLIDEEELRERFGQDSYFGQLANDALYYPSRQWANGDRTLDVEKHVFFRFLWRRMQLELKEEEEKALIELIKKGKWEEVEKTLPFSVADGEFLLRKLKELLELIMDSSKLLKSIKESEAVSPEVMSTIPNSNQFQLISKINGSEKYEWHYDFYGRKFNTEDHEIEEVKKIVEFLNLLNEYLTKVLSGSDLKNLSEYAHVVSLSPDWKDVQRAGREILSTPDHPDSDSNSIMIKEYYGKITVVGGLLAKVLYVYHFMTPYTQNVLKVLEMIGTIAPEFGISSENLDDIMTDDLEMDLSDWDGRYALNMESFNEWKEKTDLLISKVPNGLQMQDIRNELTDLWSQRLKFFFDGFRNFQIALYDLPFLVREGWKLNPHLRQMSIGTWSDFLFSYFDENAEDQNTPNVRELYRWAIPMAIVELGFSPLLVSDRNQWEHLGRWSSLTLSALENILPENLESMIVKKEALLFFGEENSSSFILKPSQNIGSLYISKVREIEILERMSSIEGVSESIRFLIFDLEDEGRIAEFRKVLPKSFRSIPIFKVSRERSKSNLRQIDSQDSVDNYWAAIMRLQIPSQERTDKSQT